MLSEKIGGEKNFGVLEKIYIFYPSSCVDTEKIPMLQ